MSRVRTDNGKIPEKLLEEMTEFIVSWDGKLPLRIEGSLKDIYQNEQLLEVFLGLFEMIHGPLKEKLVKMKKK
jgi:hypothetical protein